MQELLKCSDKIFEENGIHSQMEAFRDSSETPPDECIKTYVEKIKTLVKTLLACEKIETKSLTHDVCGALNFIHNTTEIERLKDPSFLNHLTRSSEALKFFIESQLLIRNEEEAKKRKKEFKPSLLIEKALQFFDLNGPPINKTNKIKNDLD